MKVANGTAESVARPPRQFSLRALFLLTLVVAILLTIGVIHSPWTSITIAIPLVVWFMDRARLVAPRWLAIASIALFGISLCLPAIQIHLSSTLWSNDYVVWGWNAFLGTFLSIPEILDGRWLRSEPDEIDAAFTYLFGAAANTAFLLGFLAYGLSVKFPRARTFARRAATVAAFLVVDDFALIVYTGELRDIYPGFGLWLASAMALALGARQTGSS